MEEIDVEFVLNMETLEVISKSFNKRVIDSASAVITNNNKEE